jgi:hypothetical protein
MKRFAFLFVSIVLFPVSLSFAAEEITLSAYYPAPYGEYQSLSLIEYTYNQQGPDFNIENRDTTMRANQGYGRINFVGYDANAGASGTRARIEALSVGTTGAAALQFFTAPGGGAIQEQMRIRENGYVGIGCNPQYALQINGNAYCNGASWTASDIAFKENIIDLRYGLDEVMLIQPRAFDMKTDGSHQIGFVAQEIEDIVPEVVSGEEGQKGISYGTITAVLVKAIQEQQAVINKLALDIDELKKNQNK